MLEVKQTAYCASPYNSGPLNPATNIINAQILAKTATHYGFIPVSPVETRQLGARNRHWQDSSSPMHSSRIARSPTTPSRCLKFSTGDTGITP